MALTGLIDELISNLTKPNLYCGVTVSFRSLELCYTAGASLDQSDRNSFSFVVEELGHTQFLPKNSY